MAEEPGSRRGPPASVGAADALEPGGDTVGERTLAALPWFVGARGVSEALAFASSILLARLRGDGGTDDDVVDVADARVDQGAQRRWEPVRPRVQAERLLQRAAGGARPRLDGESAKGIIAYSLAYEYQGKVSGILLRMSLSIYSRANDVAQMRSIRTRITRVHAVVIFPLMGLLAVTAPLLIPWLYGSAWSGAIVPAQILAAAGAVAAVLTSTGPFVLALGRPRVMLVWNVGLLTGYTLTVLLTVQGGLVTLCWGVLGFQVVNFVLAHVLLLWLIGGIPFARMLSEMLPAAAGTAMLVAGAFAVRTSLEGRVPTALTLALTAVAGGVVYLVVIRQAFPAAFTDLDILLRRTVPSGLVRRLGWGRG